MLALGMMHRDVVATLLPSGVDLVAFMLAARQTGFYLLPLNPRARPNELRYLLQDSRPSLLVVASACAPAEFEGHTLAGLDTKVAWIDSVHGIDLRLSAFFDEAEDVEPSLRVAGEILSYTSGTTGAPRAVLRKSSDSAPEDSLRSSLDWYARGFGLDIESPGVFLSACPIYFSGPLSFASYSLHLGRTLVLMPQWNARLALTLIGKHKVSETFLVPYQLLELLKTYQRNPQRYDIRSLKAIIHGSAPCPADLKDQALNTFGEIVYESYGSTEVAGTIAAPADARLYRGTVGRAMAPHEIKIIDNLGQPCPPGEVGKVYMKMVPGMEFSYKGDPVSTMACQIGNFATAGDLGFVNESGYLFLKGRSSDVIVCRGEKVHPTTVESAASAHPDVIDAAAFGEPCSASGETVHLAVKLSSSGRSIEDVIKEIQAHLEASLKRAEVPTSITVVNDIPRQQSGKLCRKELRSHVKKIELCDTEIATEKP